MAYTKAMQYARLAGMMSAIQRSIVAAREAAGALSNTDEIRGVLDDSRDTFRKAEEHALWLGMEESRRTD